MALKDWLKSIAFLLPLSLAAMSAPAALAQDGSCAGGSCGAGVPGCAGNPSAGCPCPGPYIHYTPKIPCIKYKCTCGKPLCNLCDMPGYGYYPTCWRAYDQPLNYACAVPTPTQNVHPPAELFVPGEEQLPTPRR
jgi:hypothetical protein